jgi:hypothetical protein
MFCTHFNHICVFIVENMIIIVSILESAYLMFTNNLVPIWYVSRLRNTPKIHTMSETNEKRCILHPSLDSSAAEGDLIQFDRGHSSLVMKPKQQGSSQKKSEYLVLCDRILGDLYDSYFYHKLWYKNFTAYRNIVRKTGGPCSSTSGHGAFLLRSSSESLASSTSGIFRKEGMYLL